MNTKIGFDVTPDAFSLPSFSMCKAAINWNASLESKQLTQNFFESKGSRVRVMYWIQTLSLLAEGASFATSEPLQQHLDGTVRRPHFYSQHFWPLRCTCYNVHVRKITMRVLLPSELPMHNIAHTYSRMNTVIVCTLMSPCFSCSRSYTIVRFRR